MPYPEPPSIIPRAYTYAEIEGMKKAIMDLSSYITYDDYRGDGWQIKHDGIIWDKWYICRSLTKMKDVEERLRTLMMCNQDPARLELERSAFISRLEIECGEKNVEHKQYITEERIKYQEAKAKNEEHKIVDDFDDLSDDLVFEIPQPTKDEVPVGLITALVFAGIAFTFLIIFT